MFRFRYKLSEILLIIGIALGIVITFHVFSIAFMMLSAGKTESYRSRSSYWIFSSEITDIERNGSMLQYIVPEETRDVFVKDIMNGLSGENAYREIAMPMPVGNTIDLRKVTGISEMSEYPLKLKKGSWEIAGNEGAEGIIWVGESWEPYFTAENGKSYLCIDSLKYHVTGVLDNTLTGGIDDTVIIYLPSCSTEAADSLNKWLTRGVRDIGDVEISFLYDSTEDAPDEEKLIQSLEAVGVSLMKNYSSYHSQGDDAKEIFQPLLLLTLTLALFTVINLFVISSFYFSTRHAELCIRKVFGFQGKALLRMLLTELCGKFLVSLIVVIPIEVLLKAFDSNLAIRLSDGPMFVVVCVLSFAVLLIFLTLRFLLLFRRIQPEDLLSR